MTEAEDIDVSGAPPGLELIWAICGGRYVYMISHHGSVIEKGRVPALRLVRQAWDYCVAFECWKKQ